jgi:uncharacterized membrane protein required for colicin V production
MEKLKKTVLMVSGPGVILLEAVALFMHLFTSVNAKPWIIAGLFVFFLVFIPLYAIEYFKQEFKKDTSKKIEFKKKKTRTEWRGGNIHGKIPTQEKRPGKLFNK